MKRSPKFWFDREKEIMRRLGLTPTKGSGSGWLEKEDGYNDNVIVQLKSTDAQSYRLSLDDIKKLEYHAMVEHKIPVFLVDFVEPNKLYVCIEINDIHDAYKYMFGSDGLIMNESATSKVEIISMDEWPIEKAKTIPKVASGDKRKYWDKKKKENERRNENWKNKQKSR